MSRIRANKITNQLADGSPTVENGLIISGITTSTTFSGSGASLTNLPAAQLSGTAAAINGSNITNLNASNIASGTVPTARLGSGTASSSTFLRGDSTFQTVNTDLVSDTSPQLGGMLDSNGSNIKMADSDIIVVGTGNDLQISHTSNISRLRGATTNDIHIESAANFKVRHQDTDGSNAEDMLICTGDGAVELYFNNSKKIETTNTGATVTGTLTATSFSGSGANLTGISAAASYNAIINGEMLVSQRANDFTGVNSSGYHLDRWYFYYQNSSAAFRIRHSGDSPDGFHQSYRVNCTTADTSIASNEEVKLFQKIEGFNLASFAKGTSGAKRFTLSFYVKCNKRGTYIVELYDRDNGRDVSGSYTVSNTNWNRYTIDFPADTTGEFGFDNGSSLEISWWLVAGSAVQSGSLGTTWASSADAGSATGQVNFTDSTSNEWMLTGVQLEPTTTGTASDFKHEDISTTLLKCKRYYQRSTDSSRGTNYTLASSSWHSADGVQSFSKHNNYYDFKERFEVEMRAAPTLTIYGSTNQGDIHIERVAVGSQQVDWNNNTTEVKTKGFLLRHIEDSYGTSGSGNGFGILAYTVDAEL